MSQLLSLFFNCVLFFFLSRQEIVLLNICADYALYIWIGIVIIFMLCATNSTPKKNNVYINQEKKEAINSNRSKSSKNDVRLFIFTIIIFLIHNAYVLRILMK